MAFIKPSLNFDGAETGLSQNKTPYLKESVQKVIFDKNNNHQGAYLYFMPPYRTDSFGQGVWYKCFEIRDNFGDKYKEKYYVPNKDQDPAEYFAKNFRMLYPEEAKVAKVTTNGKTFNKYPNFGRVTKRNIFNVAYANNLNAGVFVLDLPAVNGASQLHEWHNKTDIHGNPRGLVNDPDRALPVFIQLKDGGTNPWYLNVESSQPVALPPQLGDALYNLDDVFVSKPKEEIIAKLRDMYPADLFDRCMDGFPGLLRNPGTGFQAPPPAAVSQPAAVAAPTLSQPPKQGGFPVFGGVPSQPQPQQSGVPINTQVPQPTQEVATSGNLFVDPSSLPPNPMAGGMKMTKEQVERFLSNQ
jgi:hypothetical protein